MHNRCNMASYAASKLLLDCTVALNATEHDAQHVVRQRPAAAVGPLPQSWGSPAASPPAAEALRASPAPHPPLLADSLLLCDGPHQTNSSPLRATSRPALVDTWASRQTADQPHLSVPVNKQDITKYQSAHCMHRRLGECRRSRPAAVRAARQPRCRRSHMLPAAVAGGPVGGQPTLALKEVT